MKLLLFAIAAMALAAQTSEKLPVPAPPAEAVFLVEADGIRSKHVLSDAAIHSLNEFLHEQGFAGSFGERYIAWINKTAEVLMGREQYAPPAVKAIDAEIEAKKEERKAAIEAAKKEKKK